MLETKPPFGKEHKWYVSFIKIEKWSSFQVVFILHTMKHSQVCELILEVKKPCQFLVLQQNANIKHIH
jgi:hypothetical protein